MYDQKITFRLGHGLRIRQLKLGKTIIKWYLWTNRPTLSRDFRDNRVARLRSKLRSRLRSR